MLNNATVPLRNLVLVFCELLLIGGLLTLPLFKFNWSKFLHSDLFIKIIWWIPIFSVFVMVLYLNGRLQSIFLLILISSVVKEIWHFIKIGRHLRLLVIYQVLFILALLHFYLLGTTFRPNFVSMLIGLAFATVLADVLAFFFGNYAGYHKLPKQLNNQKSWEGVIGQVVGAGLGILLVSQFITPVASAWLFLPIGIGSAIGDLANSYVKRRLQIKDWGGSIPGHGGFTDRLSSFAGSVVLLFYFLELLHSPACPPFIR